jgi:Fic family protein
MSGEILNEIKRYYEVLQKVQQSSGDITEWLGWFLQCLKTAMLATKNAIQKISHKAGNCTSKRPSMNDNASC